jgi:hypothetical protein
MFVFARTAHITAKLAAKPVATWLNINTDGLGLSRSHRFAPKILSQARQTNTSSLYSPKTSRKREAISPTVQ